MSRTSTAKTLSFPTVNLALARRLERAEAMANAATVESRSALQPETGADWIDVAGVYAMFDGTSSPLTQTFGLGLFDPFLEREFTVVEEFFAARHAATFHEVSSFVAPNTLGLLSARGYTPIEASTVLVVPTAGSASPNADSITVRTIGSDEVSLWCRVAGQGWGGDSPELGTFMESIGMVVAHAQAAHCFLAELEGEPIAAATLYVANETAILAGASTIPAARRQGAQRALLHARLAFAADRDVDLAMIVAQPGSTSQRNAERQGFRPVYTRAKWTRRT